MEGHRLSKNCLNSATAKKLTESVVEVIVRDLRPVSTVDGDGFLNLMEVAEP